MKKNNTEKNSSGPSASVIIINWNNYEMTKRCIESVKKFTRYPRYEIILVDNGSSDKSFEKLKKDSPELVTIRNKENKGFPYALNQGYRDAKGHYLAHINNDAVVVNDWLSNAIKVLETDNKIAVAGCIEITEKEANDPKRLKKVLDSENTEKMTLPVAWVTTKTMVEKIGYLDTEFFSPIYGEEADWNFRAKNLGYRIVRVSNAPVIHSSSQDTKKILGNKKQFILINFHRHRAMLFNLSIGDILKFAPGLSLIFLTSVASGNFFNILKSYWLTLRDWKNILKQRKMKRLFVEFKEPKFTVIK